MYPNQLTLLLVILFAIIFLIFIGFKRRNMSKNETDFFEKQVLKRNGVVNKKKPFGFSFYNDGVKINVYKMPTTGRSINTDLMFIEFSLNNYKKCDFSISNTNNTLLFRKTIDKKVGHLMNLKPILFDNKEFNISYRVKSSDQKCAENILNSNLQNDLLGILHKFRRMHFLEISFFNGNFVLKDYPMIRNDEEFTYLIELVIKFCNTLRK